MHEYRLIKDDLLYAHIYRGYTSKHNYTRIIYMVASKIANNLVYRNDRTIDQEDKGYASAPYALELFSKMRVIALGKPKYTYINKGVVFYPIYLVANNKIKAQIGVYEVEKDKVVDIVDQDGDVDLEKLSSPLLYDFVTQSFVDKSGSDADLFISHLAQAETEVKSKPLDQGETKLDSVDPLPDLDEEDMTKLRISKSLREPEYNQADELLEDGIFIQDKSKTVPAPLSEETEEDAETLKSEYKESPRNTWIEKYMRNNQFAIQSVEANGDCFFAVIRDAFKQIGQNTTVAKLRAALAKEMTEELFQTHRTLYLNLQGEIDTAEKEMKEIKRVLEKDLKKRAHSVRDNRDELALIEKQTDDLKQQYVEVKKRAKSTQELISDTLQNMKNIDSLAKYREFIQTSAYWANSWAITTLETILNIKMIVLSERAYLDQDLLGVMNCTEVNEKVQETKTFKPEYYIITTHSGDHYNLVKYRQRTIFKFSEIPYQVKVLVTHKCMERAAGTFFYIQDFTDFQSKKGLAKPDIEAEKEKDEDARSANLYDPDVVLGFYARSTKTEKPGKGSHEKLPLNRRNDFTTLSQIENWRRKLDDSWTDASFKLDGKRWTSVEHYYQGAKYKKQNPDFCALFSIDSGSDISKDVALAKAAGGKTGKDKKNKIVRPKKIEMDPDFYGVRSEEARTDAVRAKFMQNQDLKQLLLATKNAKLIHLIHAQDPEVDTIMMNVRAQLPP